MCYSPTVYLAINCYPYNKGFITGLIIMWYTAGTLIFNLISTAICNPNNEKPSVVLEVNGVENKYFSIDVANNVTKMFVIIASCYVLLAVIGILLIKDIDISQLAQQVVQPENREEDSLNENDEHREHNENERNEDEQKVKDDNDIEEDAELKVKLEVETKKDIDGKMNDESMDDKEKTVCINDSQTVTEKSSPVKQLSQANLKRQETVFANPLLELTLTQSLQTRQFWQIFFCKILSGSGALFAVISFKTVGLNNNHSDQLITVAASVGSAVDGILRPFWGQGVDVLTYKYIYMIILANQIIVYATFPLVAGYAPAFFIWICLLFPCIGCHLTLLAPISIRIFGRITGTKVFGLFAFSMGISGLLAYFLQAFVVKYTSYGFLFWLLSGFSGVAFVSTLFFTETIQL
jgi:hypothetical protein